MGSHLQKLKLRETLQTSTQCEPSLPLFCFLGRKRGLYHIYLCSGPRITEGNKTQVILSNLPCHRSQAGCCAWRMQGYLILGKILQPHTITIFPARTLLVWSSFSAYWWLHVYRCQTFSIVFNRSQLFQVDNRGDFQSFAFVDTI